MKSSPLRLALVGAGGITRVHLAAIAQHPERFTLTAICDPVAKAREARAAEAGGNPALYDGWQDLLAAAPDSFDAAVICLPHHLHLPAITDLAKAGKHILCEKPLCLNLVEAQAIATVVEAAGITFMVGHNFLFLSAVRQVRAWLDEGKLGEVYWIRTQDLSRREADMIAGTWRADPKVQGGGEYIDSGYHPTYILMHLAGPGVEVEHVHAVMSRHRIQMGGEDSAVVTMRFANGVLGEIFTSWAYGNPVDSWPLHLIGEKGQIFGNWEEVHFMANDSDQRETAKLTGAKDWAGTFVVQYEHFADCVANGTEPLTSLAQSRRTLDVVLRAYQDAPYAMKMG